jgi:hypothetical protein
MDSNFQFRADRSRRFRPFPACQADDGERADPTADLGLTLEVRAGPGPKGPQVTEIQPARSDPEIFG